MNYKSLAAGFFLLLLPVPWVAAHHSVFAEFNSENPIELYSVVDGRCLEDRWLVVHGVLYAGGLPVFPPTGVGIWVNHVPYFPIIIHAVATYGDQATHEPCFPSSVFHPHHGHFFRCFAIRHQTC